ncbi:hypothetical protein [Granulicella mallensis]|jgi:hypothetical protein|uniref:Uncharacterized protein n=1 Tax=Granulicella mallensis TaxID=940614 RepID=A0A7W7ZQ27_9BACT|nr:hypothetical protein [Granulicella mallensis]MBB5063983.1 hypothetical protein [Granulicella mallensis]
MPLDSLNFHRAEYGSATPLAENCEFCTRGLGGEYFSVDHHRACGPCAARVDAMQAANTSKVFLRSIATGVLAAAMSGLVYFSLYRLTNGSWMVFAAIGVGYAIGKAMRVGSYGFGGRRYQVMAALLTYMAVVLASTLVLVGSHELPLWLYPLLLFAPLIQLFIGHFSLAALQLLFALVGMRYAWILMAGKSWKITGPHPFGE